MSGELTKAVADLIETEALKITRTKLIAVKNLMLFLRRVERGWR